VDMTVARAALSLPSIEAVQGVIDGMSRRDPATVMALLSDAAEGGADLRLFADELVVHLRALLLLRTGAGGRLSDELPTDEVAWLRERAPAWSVGALMRLVQTLSESLARTRDAQQFQVQTEVALLTACDVEAQASPASPQADRAQPRAQPASQQSDSASPQASSALPQVDSVSPQADGASPRAELASRPLDSEAASVAPGEQPAAVGQPSSTGDGAGDQAPAPALVLDSTTLNRRWPDVVDQVKSRSPLLGSALGSAHPLALEDQVLVVAFATDFNCNSAQKPSNRQLIERAFERVYGTAFRMRCTVASAAEAGSSLLDDPVINYAARTFGGQPKRLSAEPPE
jgi:DNA polymerase III subunit gamma/tau